MTRKLAITRNAFGSSVVACHLNQGSGGVLPFLPNSRFWPHSGTGTANVADQSVQTTSMLFTPHDRYDLIGRKFKEFGPRGFYGIVRGVWISLLLRPVACGSFIVSAYNT